MLCCAQGLSKTGGPRTHRHTNGNEYVGAEELKMEGKNGTVVWGRGVKKVRFDLRLGGSPIGRLILAGFQGG